MGDDTGGARRSREIITPDVQWMTYRELAEFLHMKVESARRRAQRDNWPRQLGNDGRTRVAVPGDVVAGEGSSGAMEPRDDHPGEAAALQELVAELRDQLAKAESLAEQERAERQADREKLEQAQARWEARLDRLAADLGVERTRVE